MEPLLTLAAAGRELAAMGRAAYHQWWGTLGDINVKWLSAPGRPTILLHGSYGDPSNWLDFLQAVEGAQLSGLGPVHLLKFDGIDDGLMKLTELMAGIDGKVNIAGHSLGGLVATRFAALNPDRVDKLCLLGTRLNILGDVWQDGPSFLYGDVTKAIGQVRLWTAPCEVHTFVASHDWLVPKAAVSLPGAESYLIEGVSHLSLLYSTEVHQRLMEILWY